MNDIGTAAQQLLGALDKSLYMNDYCGLEVSKHDQPDVTDAIENLRAALAELVHPAIPLENSREAADAIEATLAEYGHPTNPVNAARAGWRAARLYPAPPQQPAEPVQEPFALPCPTPKACKAHCCSGNCIPRSKA